MSHQFIYFILSSLLILSIKGVAEETSQKEKQPDVAKISEALGHLIGKNLLDMDIKLDISQVVKGLKDSSDGKVSPLSESECVKAISSAQENAFKEKAKVNLKEAEAFLKEKGKETGVVSLEDGKLQYIVEQEGSGTAVTPQGTPLVRYTGKFLNGVIFGSSKKDEVVSLDEMIPGLKTGLTGMKEGEKRTIYIHPDLGYGTAGMLPPNSLLTFEVEIIKAQDDTAKSEPTISTNADGVEMAKDGELSSADKEQGTLR